MCCLRHRNGKFSARVRLSWQGTRCPCDLNFSGGGQQESRSVLWVRQRGANDGW